MKKFKKASNLEMMKRVHQVYQWLNDGLPNLTILHNCMESYDIRISAAEKLVYRARLLLQKRFEKEMNSELPDILHKLDAIHQKTYSGEEVDYSVARQALMDKAKLLGLIRNNIDLSVNDEREYSNITEEELTSITPELH